MMCFRKTLLWDKGTLFCSKPYGPTLCRLGCIICLLLHLVPRVAAAVERQKSHLIHPGSGNTEDEAVIWSSSVGHNTMCQAQVCVLGESLLVWCFHLCSQQEDRTEEWAADSWREKGSGNLSLFFFFFFHRENKKEKAALLGKQLY